MIATVAAETIARVEEEGGEIAELKRKVAKEKSVKSSRYERRSPPTPREKSTDKSSGFSSKACWLLRLVITIT